MKSLCRKVRMLSMKKLNSYGRTNKYEKKTEITRDKYRGIKALAKLYVRVLHRYLSRVICAVFLFITSYQPRPPSTLVMKNKFRQKRLDSLRISQVIFHLFEVKRDNKKMPTYRERLFQNLI